MNRSLVSRTRTNDDKWERRYRCDGCKWWFAYIEDPGANVGPLESVTGAWCPCKPWNIHHVQVGMHLPEGWVIGLDRLAETVTLGESLSADMQSTCIVPFSKVSPPQ